MTANRKIPLEHPKGDMEKTKSSRKKKTFSKEGDS